LSEDIMSERNRTVRTRPLLALLVGLVCVLVIAGQAIAHAVVYPPEAPTGAYQKYVLRVPNERGFPTSEVSITFPDGVRVISFDEVPGWTLETTSMDGGATFATATWAGTLPVGRFVEFAFIGVNPAEPTVLEWDVIQTYADGTAVPWTGPVDSSTPASTTSVVAQLGAAAPPEAPTSGLGTVLGAVALLVALLGLGLALRPARPA
jgi:uncharacterized protein YcnI